MRFELHTIPLKSRLEAWREDIVAMRAAVWPYRRIAKWLRDEKAVSISREAVRQFCVVRGIEKGTLSFSTRDDAQKRSPTAQVSRVRRKREVTKKFDYDDSQPIRRKDS